MSDGACPDCGAPVKRVTIAPTREIVALDTVAVWNGRYTLDANDTEAALPIASPGRMGHIPHHETCPAVERPRTSAL